MGVLHELREFLRKRWNVICLADLLQRRLSHWQRGVNEALEQLASVHLAHSIQRLGNHVEVEGALSTQQQIEQGPLK